MSWDNQVALVVQLPTNQNLVNQINSGAFNNFQDGAVEQNISILKTIFGQYLKIITICTFKTPFSEKQISSLIGYHQYAIVQTQNEHEKIVWSVQKKDSIIWLTAHNSFERGRDYGPTNQRRYQSEYWKPILKKQKITPKDSDFYDLVRWVYKELHNKKGYSFFVSNCKSFCDNLYKHFY